MTSTCVAPTERVYDPFDTLIHQSYPAQLYAWLRDDRPVYYNETHDFWALSRFDDVQTALRDWHTYSHAGPHGVHVRTTRMDLYGARNFLEEDPPRHTVLRKVVRNKFALAEIGRFTDQVRKIATELFAPIQAAGGGDIASAYCWPLAFNVVAELLGIPPSDYEWLDAVLKHFLPTAEDITVDFPPSVIAAGGELRDYVSTLLDHKEHGDLEKGIISDVAAALSSGLITHLEAVGIPMLFFEAAIETPATFLANALLLLAVHGDQRELIRTHHVDHADAIEELLRYQSPTQCLARTSTKPAQLHSVEIPQGATVLLAYGAANRDDRRWQDPDALDVQRPPLRHLAFGDGLHHCLGAPLARLQARITLELILGAAPDYEISGPVTYLMKYSDWGVQKLYLTF